jgi:UDP-N-acetylglucosamine 4,6-dehydratase
MMTGGEIFIPKIPSMSVVDLARFLAPNLPRKVVGIRPGEKLHEAMSTEDDARNMLELDDRYVITPELGFWKRDAFKDLNARPVAEGFHYASNTNGEWLDGGHLRRLLAESGIV